MMRLLLDTHAFHWTVADSAKLSQAARVALRSEANTVYVSIASAWEMAIKTGRGKWPEATAVLENFEEAATRARCIVLGITLSHARFVGLMQIPHRDPFDRLLLAQAQIEGMTLATADKAVQRFGSWLW